MHAFAPMRLLDAPGAVLACAALMLFAVACVRALRRRSPDILKRGVILAQAGSARHRARIFRRRAADAVTLAGVPVAVSDETRHFKVIGTTGTGKSTVIREILGAALARGDRAIIADPDGGYRAHFFQRYRGDVLLNPFERESVKWDPFAEIHHAYDVDQLASSLVPTSADPGASEWRAYARTFLAAVLRRCAADRSGDSAELWRLLSAAPPEELRPVVAGTAAQPFVEGENSRMFASIRSVAVSAMAAFDYVQRQRAVPFSIREWVSRRGHPGVLFLPYEAGQIAALKSMIATWMRLAIFEALSGAADHDQRIWFVIDELDALGAIDGLKDALARLRKFGGRCVLGFQALAQVSATYGQEAQTLVENCGNTLILRYSASENGGTSQFASRLIGEREVLRRQISRGRDREGGWPARGPRRSTSVIDQHVTEPAVLASEIEQLPDFCGFLKTASSPVWLKVAFGARS